MKILRNTIIITETAGCPGCAVMYVLTEGSCADKAVYMGVINHHKLETNEQRERAAERIAFGGLKLRYEGALQFYPDLKKSEYRA